MRYSNTCKSCTCTHVVVYNPRHLENLGLSDGETLEKLWSYLQKFSPMTKEMRPSHRIDVLSDALKYYSHKAISGLG